MKYKETQQGVIRIIGGQWRSRLIHFAESEGLRPTPDRVRETLFNWLAPYINGAKVLDLYTGSGALFFEALSRGATKAIALDVNKDVVNQLKQHLNMFHAANGIVKLENALTFLAQEAIEPFDIVFLDPPFHKQFIEKSCELLETNHWLTKAAWIYIESERSPSTLALPPSWQLHREKKAGQVYYALWHRAA